MQSVAVDHSSSLLYDHPVLFTALVTIRIYVFVGIFKICPHQKVSSMKAGTVLVMFIPYGGKSGKNHGMKATGHCPAGSEFGGHCDGDRAGPASVLPLSSQVTGEFRQGGPALKEGH